MRTTSCLAGLRSYPNDEVDISHLTLGCETLVPLKRLEAEPLVGGAVVSPCGDEAYYRTFAHSSAPPSRRLAGRFGRVRVEAYELQGSSHKAAWTIVEPGSRWSCRSTIGTVVRAQHAPSHGQCLSRHHR